MKISSDNNVERTQNELKNEENQVTTYEEALDKAEILNYKMEGLASFPNQDMAFLKAEPNFQCCYIDCFFFTLIHIFATVTRVLTTSKQGYGPIQRVLILVGGLLLFTTYVSVGAIAFILPAAQCDLHMDSEEKGKLISIFFVGLIISCHLWGFLSDTLGRRYILIRCLLLDGLLYIVTSVTPYYSLILVLRLVHGFIGSGCAASVYAYIGEFFTDKERSKSLMIASMIGISVDTVLAVSAWLIINGNWSFEIYSSFIFKPWRLYYCACGFPSLICFICLCFLPESPKCLLANGQKAKSIEILKWMHNINRKNETEEFSVKDIVIDEKEMVAKLGDGSNKTIAFFKVVWNQTIPLFKRQHIKNLMLMCSLQFLTYFTNGGLYLWLPETLNRLAIFSSKTQNKYASYCDVVQYGRHPDEIKHTQTLHPNNVGNFFNFTESIEDQNNICDDKVEELMYFYMVMLGVFVFVLTGLTAVLVKIFNNKYVVVMMAIAALWLSTGTQFVKITYTSGYFPCLLAIVTGVLPAILSSIAVDLFPTNLRGMACCLILLCCRLGTMTTTIIAGFLIDNNCKEFIWCFIVANILFFIISIWIPNKTNETNKKQENIQLGEK